MTIKILDDNLINKIAAGEVVERPSSILRELIENSIDAKSDKIEVYIEDAGIKKLMVIDNGVGISKEELKIAVLRHATSKIVTEDDLFSISSLGFRGEALPSIASVSKFTISSKTKESDIGYRIKLENGKIVEENPVAMKTGTKIEVENLFYNVPARRKFLKREATEFSHLYKSFFNFLLVYNDITFEFYKENKKYKFFPKESAKKRVSEIFPKEASELFPISLDVEDFKIEGFIGNPELSYRRSHNLYTFINGRFIRDKTIIHAIAHGYRSILDSREYPFVILFFQINPKLVDVNVHPQKLEVRFNDSRKVHLIISKTIEETLAKTPWVKKDLNVGSSLGQNLEGENRDPKSFFNDTTQLDHFNKSLANSLFSPDFLERSLKQKDPSLSNEGDFIKPMKRNYFSSLDVIGQAHLTYIICQDEDGLVLIDQHAAHERVGYENLLNGYNNKKIQTESLLIPLILLFSPEKFSNLKENLSFLNESGFEIDIFGPDSIAIRKIPYIFRKANIEKLIREVVDDYFTSDFSMAYEDKIKHIFSTISCHSVTRAGDKLNNYEIKSLLEQMDEINFSANCPHGRPVYYKISKYELDKKFHRV